MTLGPKIYKSAIHWLNIMSCEVDHDLTFSNLLEFPRFNLTHKTSLRYLKAVSNYYYYDQYGLSAKNYVSWDN